MSDDAPPAPLAPYQCAQIFYRAARSSRWIRPDGTVTKQAFRRSPPPYDRKGLSGSPFREHCADNLPPHANKGTITILVGWVRDLELDVVPDSPTHGNIEGIPDRDENEESRARHDFLATRLAERARSLPMV
jgi:hypothetical protein